MNFSLQSSPKTYTFDQDKCLRPEETWDRAMVALNRTFPTRKYIYKELYHSENTTIYNFTDGGIKSRGKGITRAQARASVIMEYIERFSWIFYSARRTPEYQKISYNELCKNKDISYLEPVFHVCYSKKKDSLSELIKTLPLLWIPAFSLSTNTPTFYPINWNSFYQGLMVLPRAILMKRLSCKGSAN